MTLRRLVGWLGLMLAVLGLGLLLAVGVGPRTGRYQVLTVLSASMQPAFAPGSLLVVTPVDRGDVRVGDVITYQIPVEDHRVVSHRVVEIVEAGDQPVVRTKGDANAGPDPWLARLEGGPAWRARADVPHAGAALRALRHPVVRRVSVQALPVLLAVLWLGAIWRPRPSPAEAGGV